MGLIKGNFEFFLKEWMQNMFQSFSHYYGEYSSRKCVSNYTKTWISQVLTIGTFSLIIMLNRRNWQTVDCNSRYLWNLWVKESKYCVTFMRNTW